MNAIKRDRLAVATYFQWVATSLLLVLGAAAAGATIAGALGVLPTLTLPLQFGETVIPNAGLAVQTLVVVLLLSLLCAMPSGFRVLRLEKTHRDFNICMSDVADAYEMCHAADREGTFKLSSEYDAVRERIMYLREHPDLGALEPSILESAAQMSYASRELAEIYSDENVSRARGFLKHRQEEIALFEDRIDRALTISRELRRQREAVEIEENAMDSRLSQLEEEYGALLQELGFSRPARDGNVIAMPHATAAE